jgi:hypothetical protein
MADPHSTPAQGDNAAVHHETTDVNIRAILGFGAGLIVVGIMVHVAIWLLFMFFAAREAQRVAPEFPLSAGQADRVPPEPRLQTNPRQDLRDLRSGEDAILSTYGWVDRNAGIVRIPVTDAMKLTVQRGLPARTATGDKGK